MNKKLLLGLGSYLIVAIPTVSAISCGTTSQQTNTIHKATIDDSSIDATKVRATIDGQNLPINIKDWEILSKNKDSSEFNDITNQWVVITKVSKNVTQVIFETDKINVENKIIKFKLKNKEVISNDVEYKPSKPEQKPVVTNVTTKINNDDDSSILVTINGNNLPTDISSYEFVLKNVNQKIRNIDNINIEFNGNPNLSKVSIKITGKGLENIYDKQFTIIIDSQTFGEEDNWKFPIKPTKPDINPIITEVKSSNNDNDSSILVTINGNNLPTDISLYEFTLKDNFPEAKTIENIELSFEGTPNNSNVIIKLSGTGLENVYSKEFILKIKGQIFGQENTWKFPDKPLQPGESSFTNESANALKNIDGNIIFKIYGENLSQDINDYIFIKDSLEDFEDSSNNLFNQKGWTITHGNDINSLVFRYTKLSNDNNGVGNSNIEVGNYTLSFANKVSKAYTSMSIYVSDCYITNVQSTWENDNLKITVTGINLTTDNNLWTLVKFNENDDNETEEDILTKYNVDIKENEVETKSTSIVITLSTKNNNNISEIQSGKYVLSFKEYAWKEFEIPSYTQNNL